MSKSAPRLGKGLSALISPHVQAGIAAAGDEAPGPERLRSLPVERIRPNPRQPRAALDSSAMGELTESVRSQGVLQPVLVRPLADGYYELVAGERRWRAARQAGLERVPAIVRAASDAESLELALIENLQREDLDPLERAGAYRQYLDMFDVGVDELARRLGESRPNIANYMRLLQLGEEIQDMIRRGQLGMGQARAIAGVEGRQRQLAVARLAVRRNLSVRQVEALAKRGGVQVKQGAAVEPRSRHVEDVEQVLSRGLGLPVRLLPGKKKNSGRVVIKYGSLEQFDRIAERLGGRCALE